MGGAYWGTGSSRSRYDDDDAFGYTTDLASEVISEIRTDLDRFSIAEAAVLENRGHFLADNDWPILHGRALGRLDDRGCVVAVILLPF